MAGAYAAKIDSYLDTGETSMNARSTSCPGESSRPPALLFFLLMMAIPYSYAGNYQYVEEVNIPPYNADDSSHVLITISNGKWSSTVLNDARYRHFYIQPGKYDDRVIVLTESGSKNDRRTLSLYNGNDEHPASLSDEEQASVRIYFDGASYWSIDRISYLDNRSSFFIRNGSSNNVLNRVHMRNYGQYCVYIRYGSDNNSIQNSYFDTMHLDFRRNDGVCINLIVDNHDDSRLYGNKIINNDIRNAGDGVQLTINWNATLLGASMPGTIIDNNRIWCDSDIYTDRDGTPNSAGKYMVAENALDFKRGSFDPGNPVVVTNNIMWGMRHGAQVPNSAFDGGLQTITAFHYGVENLLFKGNILFDAERSMSIADPRFAPYSAGDIVIENNIFADIGAVNPEENYIYNIIMEQVLNIKTLRNSIIRTTPFDASQGRFVSFSVDSINTDFIANVAIDSYETSKNRGGNTDKNYFYNSPVSFEADTNTRKYATAEEARMDDYSFLYERYSVTPKQMTLRSVITTKDSPHYGVAGSDIPKYHKNEIFSDGFEWAQ